MSDSLKTTLGKIQQNLKKNPSEATVTFQSNSSLIEGFNSRAILRQHSIDVDEPKELGRNRPGPEPGRAYFGGSRYLPGNHLQSLCDGSRYSLGECFSGARGRARPAGISRLERRDSSRLPEDSRPGEDQVRCGSRDAREAPASRQRALPGSRHHLEPRTSGARARRRSGRGCGAAAISRIVAFAKL